MLAKAGAHVTKTEPRDIAAPPIFPKEAHVALQTRSKPRQIFYLMLALIGLTSLLYVLSLWRL
jgi:hypothetical protein